MSIWTVTTRILNATDTEPAVFTQSGTIEQHPALVSQALDGLVADGFTVATCSEDGLIVGLIRWTVDALGTRQPDIATVIVTVA